jgi:hypothetical protein
VQKISGTEKSNSGRVGSGIYLIMPLTQPFAVSIQPWLV